MEHKLENLRCPIVTICGHVDHGKTSILDCIRGTCVAEQEAGRITQKISFSLLTKKIINERIGNLLKSYKIDVTIPGFLFIDTPGHAAFTNLRKRGGSLADLAVLVIDINEGIKPQTAEVIHLLKINKTPFVIALNKIDNISGWRKTSNLKLKDAIDSQHERVKQIFNEKYLTLIGSLNSHGFDSELFYNISDFTKKIALVPCSASTKEGIFDLIMVLCGLSQKYLSDRLTLGKEAKGIVLEIKKESSINYVEAILYDGELSKKDEIAIANFDKEPVITKIRILEEIRPLGDKFDAREKVCAATGLRMQFVEKAEILPGMPFVVYRGNKEEIKSMFKKEISENVKTQSQGIIAKADSLGSLEALLLMLKENKIPVLKASIGKINKADIVAAKANLEINELDAIIVGFNVSIDDEAKELAGITPIKIIMQDVVYKLIEEIIKFREEKRKEIEKKRLMSLASVFKLKILPQFVFRNTKPAIFGVRIEAGRLAPNIEIIDDKGERIGRIKNIQSENKSVQDAVEGMEVAISVPGVNFERQLKKLNFLYSNITEKQIKKFLENKDLLSHNEIKTLHEIEGVKNLKK